LDKCAIVKNRYLDVKEVNKMRKGIEWVVVGIVITILIFFFSSQFHQRHLSLCSDGYGDHGIICDFSPNHHLFAEQDGNGRLGSGPAF